MPRDFDLSDIPTDRRVFIKTGEWDPNEKREYWFTGKEKADRVSQRTGKPYTSYLVYLIPAGGEFSPELTLEIFASQAKSLKESGLLPYQKVSVTKLEGEKGSEWEFKSLEGLMPEKQRPALSDYPPLSAPAMKPKDEGEINIDDIPF